MNSGSSALTALGLTLSAALAIRSEYQRSRPATLQGRFVAFHQHDFFDARAVLERFVGDRFERNALAGAQRDVGGDQHRQEESLMRPPSASALNPPNMTE
jgi:hypothetical protein